MGITVFAILSIIIGVADFVAVLFLGSLLGAAWLQFGVYGSLIGGVLVFQGIVLFVLAYGFLNGNHWAWTLGLIFGVWDGILGLILLPAGIIRIIYVVILIYYLLDPL